MPDAAPVSSPARAPMTPAERRWSLVAVIAHMLAIGLTIGVTVPLTSLVLEDWGVETWQIGLVAAMPAAAILLFMPYFPRVIGRVGALPAMVGGCLAGIVAILLQPLLPSVAAWAVLRFVLGAGLALPWLVGETWINTVALEGSRGRVLGLYAAALFAGFAVGPLLLDAVGPQGWPPFLVAAGAVAAAILPLVLAQRLAPPMVPNVDLKLRAVVRAAPTVACAGLAAGLLESAYYALLPLQALRSGLPESLSLQVLAVFLVGGIALQLPVGWAADRSDRRLLLCALGTGAGLAALALPVAIGHQVLLFGLVFVLGGLSLGLYTVGLALLAQRFPGADLAVANAVFILLYELGSFVGPGLAGAAMDLSPRYGLAGASAAIAFVFALLALGRAGARAGRNAAAEAGTPPTDTR